MTTLMFPPAARAKSQSGELVPSKSASRIWTVLVRRLTLTWVEGQFEIELRLSRFGLRGSRQHRSCGKDFATEILHHSTSRRIWYWVRNFRGEKKNKLVWPTWQNFLDFRPRRERQRRKFGYDCLGDQRKSSLQLSGNILEISERILVLGDCGRSVNLGNMLLRDVVLWLFLLLVLLQQHGWSRSQESLGRCGVGVMATALIHVRKGWPFRNIKHFKRR